MSQHLELELSRKASAGAGRILVRNGKELTDSLIGQAYITAAATAAVIASISIQAEPLGGRFGQAK